MTLPTKVSYTNLNSASFIGYKNFFLLLFAILLTSFVLALTIQLWTLTSEGSSKYEKLELRDILNLPEVQLKSSSKAPTPYQAKCTYWDCFNIYNCGRTGHDRIAVYIYPPKKYVTEDGLAAAETMSKQYYMMLESIINSKYYTANPNEACIYVPSIDTLNQYRINVNLTSFALESLPL